MYFLNYFRVLRQLPILLISILLFGGCSDDPEYKGKGIHNYFCSSGRIRLGNGLRNASGITFNHDTGTLFIIQDSPVWIHEVTTDGKMLRIITVSNADDTEGIAYLGDDNFAILEEGSSKVYICKIDNSTQTIDLAQAEFLKINQPDDNTGLEGITYLPRKQLFYAVKEKSPKVIYKIDYTTGKVETPWDLETIGIKDVSGICFNPIDKTLLLLSHESYSIVEVTMEGKIISRLALREKRNGLDRDIKKAEGITIDSATGTIYICGEKEEFYVFEDPTRIKD